MPSLTFLALLNEGHKLEVYENKMLLTIASFPYLDADDQETIRSSLQLPDDVLSDILDSETPDDIKELEDALNGN